MLCTYVCHLEIVLCFYWRNSITLSMSNLRICVACKRSRFAEWILSALNIFRYNLYYILLFAYCSDGEYTCVKLCENVSSRPECLSLCLSVSVWLPSDRSIFTCADSVTHRRKPTVTIVSGAVAWWGRGITPPLNFSIMENCLLVGKF